jgi:hypothetical protein
LPAITAGAMPLRADFFQKNDKNPEKVKRPAGSGGPWCVRFMTEDQFAARNSAQ